MTNHARFLANYIEMGAKPDEVQQLLQARGAGKAARDRKPIHCQATSGFPANYKKKAGRSGGFTPPNRILPWIANSPFLDEGVCAA
jgi:hypothetical protein